EAVRVCHGHSTDRGSSRERGFAGLPAHGPCVLIRALRDSVTSSRSPLRHRSGPASTTVSEQPLLPLPHGLALQTETKEIFLWRMTHELSVPRRGKEPAAPRPPGRAPPSEPSGRAGTRWPPRPPHPAVATNRSPTVPRLPPEA